MPDVPFETRLRQHAEQAVLEADWSQLDQLIHQGLRWSKMLREAPPVLAAAQSPDPDALPRLLREGLVWESCIQRVRAVEPYGEALRYHGLNDAVLVRFHGWRTAGITVAAVDPADRQVARRNPLHALNAQGTTADPRIFAATWDLLVSAGADPQGRAWPVDAFTDAHALAQRPTAEAVRAAQDRLRDQPVAPTPGRPRPARLR